MTEYAREQTDDFDELRAEVEQLRRRLEEVQAKLSEVTAERNRLAHEVPERMAPSTDDEETSNRHRPKQRAARETILDALEDLGCLAYSRELSQYCQAWFGREIALTRFGTVGSDEIAAFRRHKKTAKPAYLCFALTYDRYEPIKRLWGRSDWPLEWRIVAPTTGRWQHLKITARLCEMALRAHEIAADPDMMCIIAADHARDLPGVKVQRGTFELERWREVAFEALQEVEPRDEQMRQEGAERLRARGLDEIYELFGVPEVIEMPETSKRAQRG